MIFWLRQPKIYTEVVPLTIQPTARVIQPSNRAKRHHDGAVALFRVALCRLRWDPTRAYAVRRTKDGLSKKEIIRCLKRYIARELYQLISSNDLELAA
jgi:hypothetical protein